MLPSSSQTSSPKAKPAKYAWRAVGGPAAQTPFWRSALTGLGATVPASPRPSAGLPGVPLRTGQQLALKAIELITGQQARLQHLRQPAKLLHHGSRPAGRAHRIRETGRLRSANQPQRL
jgi:hypothetical protein